MLYVRKVQRVNKSLMIVLPVEVAKYICVEKGSHVMIRRVTGDRRNGVLIEKLDTKQIEREAKYVGQSNGQ